MPEEVAGRGEDDGIGDRRQRQRSPAEPAEGVGREQAHGCHDDERAGVPKDMHGIEARAACFRAPPVDELRQRFG